jgi:hypothetical protein
MGIVPAAETMCTSGDPWYTVRRLILNAIVWAAKLGVPEGGVASTCPVK